MIGCPHDLLHPDIAAVDAEQETPIQTKAPAPAGPLNSGKGAHRSAAYRTNLIQIADILHNVCPMFHQIPMHLSIRTIYTDAFNPDEADFFSTRYSAAERASRI